MPLLEDTQLEEIKGLQSAIAAIKQHKPVHPSENRFKSVETDEERWAKELHETASELNEILAAPLSQAVVPALYTKLREGNRPNLQLWSRKDAVYFTELDIAGTQLYLLSSQAPEGEVSDIKQLSDNPEGQFGLLFYRPNHGGKPFELFTLVTAHADELTPQLEEAWRTLGRVMPEFVELKELESSANQEFDGLGY